MGSNVTESLGADRMQITINLPEDIELDEAIRQQAEFKARQTYIMELLRHGSISTGYAAQNLNLSRLEILDLIGQYKISIFPEQTPEELAQEVAETCNLIQP
jgi:predicted HTH domain antitoxin